MNCPTCTVRLNELLDGELDPEAIREVEAHLAGCPACRQARVRLEALREEIARLPRDVAPGADLWPAVEAGLEERVVPLRRASTARLHGRPRRGSRHWFAFVALAASVAILITRRPADAPADAAPGWTVTAVDGIPRVGSQAVVGEARLPLGGWLETDAGSSAKVAAGSIGEVRLAPNSRLRLTGVAEADHRVELARGTLEALIWSPPRIFFVDTPTATAIDLGCAYTLSVDDDGGGRLSVTSGYVALQAPGGREIIVPAGMTCLTRPGKGPGTPFATPASAGLREAVQRYDAGGDPATAIAEILRLAGAGDGVMLWHLLRTAPAAQRGAVYDRLATLVAPPAGVTRAGLVAGDEAMHRQWGEYFVFALIGQKMMVAPSGAGPAAP